MLGEGGRFSSAPRLANLSLFDVRTPAPDASSQLFDVDVLYAPGPGASVLLSLNRLDVDAENIFRRASPALKLVGARLTREGVMNKGAICRLVADR